MIGSSDGPLLGASIFPPLKILGRYIKLPTVILSMCCHKLHMPEWYEIHVRTTGMEHNRRENHVLCKFVGQISEQRFLEKLNCMKHSQMPKEKVQTYKQTQSTLMPGYDMRRNETSTMLFRT